MVRLLFVLLVLSLSNQGFLWKISGDYSPIKRRDRTVHSTEKIEDICFDNQECKGDHIGYCTNHNWTTTFNCALIGKTCIGAKCETKSCSPDDKCFGSLIVICIDGVLNPQEDCYPGTCVEGVCVPTTSSSTTSSPTTSSPTTSSPTTSSPTTSSPTTSSPTTSSPTTSSPTTSSPTTSPPTTSSPTTSSPTTSSPTTSSSTIPNPTPPNTQGTTPGDACSGNGRRCNGSILEICVGGNWDFGIDCSGQGLVCDVDKCVAAPPSTTPSICPSITVNISSLSPNINVPNLDDPLCNSFYNCSESLNRGDIITCEKTPCSGTLVFDACLGFCTSSAICSNTQISCYSESCPSPRTFQPLTKNNMLGYACLKMGNNFVTLWKFCPNGEVITGSGGCTPTKTSCTNGLDGSCTEPGPKPIPGTTCKYRYCYADGTHRDVSCSNGYHYDHSAKGCITGTCENTLSFQ